MATAEAEDRRPAAAPHRVSRSHRGTPRKEEEEEEEGDILLLLIQLLETTATTAAAEEEEEDGAVAGKSTAATPERPQLSTKDASVL